MVEPLLSILGSTYPLTKVDAGEFRKMKVSGMDFTVTPYDAKGLGRVCVMDVSGMLGLMKMQTLIVNPFCVDAPLLSLDAISAMGKETLFLEPFNTQLAASFDESGMLAVREKYASIPDKDPGQHWYDSLHLRSATFKSGKKCRAELESLAEDYYRAYLAAVREMPACDEAEKRRKAAEYSEGLAEHGGPATDPFIKKYGREKTTQFFRTVLFGTGDPN